MGCQKTFVLAISSSSMTNRELFFIPYPVPARIGDNRCLFASDSGLLRGLAYISFGL